MKEPVAFLPLDSKDALDHVLPAEEHRALGCGQLRMLGHEVIHHGATVGQATLQHKVVEKSGNLGPVRHDPFAKVLFDRPPQGTVKAESADKLQKIALEISTAPNEV